MVQHGELVTVTWKDGTQSVEKLLIQRRITKFGDYLIPESIPFVIKDGLAVNLQESQIKYSIIVSD